MRQNEGLGCCSLYCCCRGNNFALTLNANCAGGRGKLLISLSAVQEQETVQRRFSFSYITFGSSVIALNETTSRRRTEQTYWAELTADSGWAFQGCVRIYVFYLFMVYLTRLSVAQIVQYRVMGWLVDNELGRMWKEAVVPWFKVLSQHFPLGAEEHHGKSYDSPSQGPDLDPGPPEYEAGVSITPSRR
jgi:hypothetical protein